MNTRLNWICLLAGAAALCSGAGCAGQPYGVAPARMKPCPDTPNCVSSLETDPGRRVEPIPYQGSPAEAGRALREVIEAMPRTRIRDEAGGYLHVEFTSALFLFVDDVEFLVEEARPVIQVRSASRVGYWDLGANRRRVEQIRRAMTPAPAKEGK